MHSSIEQSGRMGMWPADRTWALSYGTGLSTSCLCHRLPERDQSLLYEAEPGRENSCRYGLSCSRYRRNYWRQPAWRKSGAFDTANGRNRYEYRKLWFLPGSPKIWLNPSRRLWIGLWAMCDVSYRNLKYPGRYSISAHHGKLRILIFPISRKSSGSYMILRIFFVLL